MKPMYPQPITEEMYRFFWDIAFHNEQPYFEANRKRYEAQVKAPLYALTEYLMPTALKMDERFNRRTASCVSRLRRDTRYTHDKTLYRDHAWIGFRLPGTYISECFSAYIEFNRDSYGYGMGMYAPNTEMMQSIRNRILARPIKFLDLLAESEFSETFTLVGESFKRKRQFDAPEQTQRYLNCRGLSFCYSSSETKNTLRPDFCCEAEHALEIMTPVYRFLTGLK